MLSKQKYLFLCCVAFLFGCAKEGKLMIGFSSDSANVVISGMNDKSLAYLRNNIAIDSNYQNLVQVLQLIDENDTTSRELPIPGVLKLDGDTLVFKPNSPFKRGREYLIQTIVGAEFGAGADIVSSNVGHQVKMMEKTLKR